MESSTRELKQIESDLNRAKAHLEQLNNHTSFTEEDKKILRPDYENIIKNLELERTEAIGENEVVKAVVIREQSEGK